LGKRAGVYNVTVTNTDGLSGTKAGAFTILNPEPKVNAVDPVTGQNTGPKEIIIIGENFLEGVNASLERASEPPIPADPVNRVNATYLRCTFNLTGKAAGAWTARVTNPDGRSSAENVIFTITNPPPVPQNITPSTGSNDDSILIKELKGSGFLLNASVKLARAGENDIPGQGVVVNVTTQTIMCFFNLNGARVGYWDVVVANDDGQSGKLENGFFVQYPEAPTVLSIDRQSLRTMAQSQLPTSRVRASTRMRR